MNKRAATSQNELTSLQASCLRVIAAKHPYGSSFTEEDIFGEEGLYNLRNSLPGESDFFRRWFAVKNRAAWLVNLWNGLVRKGYVSRDTLRAKPGAERFTISERGKPVVSAPKLASAG